MRAARDKQAVEIDGGFCAPLHRRAQRGRVKARSGWRADEEIGRRRRWRTALGRKLFGSSQTYGNERDQSENGGSQPSDPKMILVRAHCDSPCAVDQQCQKMRAKLGFRYSGSQAG
jgi:hypothetical protein